MPGGRERLSSARGRQRGRCPRRGPGRRGALHAGPGLSPRRPGPAAPSSPAAEPRRRRRVRRWRPPAALNDRAVEIRESHQRRVAALDPGNQVIARYRPRANVAGQTRIRTAGPALEGTAGLQVPRSLPPWLLGFLHLLIFWMRGLRTPFLIWGNHCWARRGGGQTLPLANSMWGWGVLCTVGPWAQPTRGWRLRPSPRKRPLDIA